MLKYTAQQRMATSAMPQSRLVGSKHDCLPLQARKLAPSVKLVPDCDPRCGCEFWSGSKLVCVWRYRVRRFTAPRCTPHEPLWHRCVRGGYHSGESQSSPLKRCRGHDLPQARLRWSMGRLGAWSLRQSCRTASPLLQVASRSSLH